MSVVNFTTAKFRAPHFSKFPRFAAIIVPMQIICRAILFDMDGVLVDSTPAVARVWTTWALKHSLDPRSVVVRAHGRPSMATIQELLPHGDHESENRWMENAEIEDVSDVLALPGAVALLNILPSSSFAIVTSATRPLAEVRLRAAGLLVPKNLVTAGDVPIGKPSPQPYLHGAALLGVPPGDCVIIEDAPAGVLAGKAAGAKVIALRTTTPDKELRRRGADWIVDNCAALSLKLLTTKNQLDISF